MSFKLQECSIPVIWCGNGDMPKKKVSSDTHYYKTGTRYECMKKGFGAGMHTERKANLPDSSLQNIKYVGDVYEERFKSQNINTISQLLNYSLKSTPRQIEALLREVFKRKKSGVDQRAYNSTLIYLYRHGNGNLPKCSKIKT